MPIHARFVDDIATATEPVRSLPPMMTHINQKTGKSYTVSTKAYRLRIDGEEFMDPLSPDKYPYWKLTASFADDADIEAYGNWTFMDIYSNHPKIRDRKNLQIRHLLENLNLPYNGDGIIGKVVTATLTTRTYTASDGKEVEKPDILRLDEWDEPQDKASAPNHDILF